MTDLFTNDNKVIEICISSKEPVKKNKYEQIMEFVELFQVYRQYPNWMLGRPVKTTPHGRTHCFEVEKGVIGIITKTDKQKIKTAWWRIRHHKGFLNRHELKKYLKQKGEKTWKRL